MTKITKQSEKPWTAQKGDYYMLPGDCTRYTRKQILEMTMDCKDGVTNRFAPDPNSGTFSDRKTSRSVFVRNDTSVPPPVVSKPKRPPVVSLRGAILAQAMKEKSGTVVHSAVTF